MKSLVRLGSYRERALLPHTLKENDSPLGLGSINYPSSASDPANQDGEEPQAKNQAKNDGWLGAVLVCKHSTSDTKPYLVIIKSSPVPSTGMPFDPSSYTSLTSHSLFFFVALIPVIQSPSKTHPTREQ